MVDDTVFVTPRPAPADDDVDDADADAADGDDSDDDGAVDPGLEQTMVEPPEGHDDEPVAAPAPVAPAAPVSAPVPDVDDDAIESTVVRPVTASDLPTTATPTLSTAGDELGDHDGMTVMRDDLDELRAKSQPVSESTIEPVPVIEAAPRYELVFASGSVETLDQPIVIGRAPTVSKESAGALPRLIAISDDQDVSRTHVRFTVEGDSVVVTDLNSRNGTVVTLPGAPPQQLRGGEPTTVLTGTSVDLGGGVVISVREGS
ncbi:MAG: FHA domain-containing protein [Microbacteriaceae bacterium]